MQWQRRRHPLDVPTPVAVALSDFCRRAKAPAAASQIRDALSLLDEADDFRVRELADGDATVTPLGPFAAIDIVMGTASELASQRESTGYYELARQLLADAPLPERDAPLTATPAAEAPDDEPVEPLFVDENKIKRQAKADAKAKASVAQRIAPKKRTDGPPPRVLSAPKDSNYRKRDLPKGRGRFTVVETAARSIDELTRDAARDELLLLIEQSGNRIALKRRLATGFASPRGKALSQDDVDTAIEKQKLTPQLEQKERESILSALHQSRGARQRAAQSLAMSPTEMDQLIKSLDLTREANDIRERFCREALSSRYLGTRLSMVSRMPYLRDLGIEKKFRESLERDLRELFDRTLGHQVSLEALIDAVARREGLKADQLETALSHLGLAQRYRERLSST